MVKHLVAAIREPIDVAVARGELQQAHDYLASAAMTTAKTLPTLRVTHWGGDAKRTTVLLAGEKPPRVSRDVTHHSFAEIVNQCATLERSSVVPTNAQHGVARCSAR